MDPPVAGLKLGPLCFATRVRKLDSMHFEVGKGAFQSSHVESTNGYVPIFLFLFRSCSKMCWAPPEFELVLAAKLELLVWTR